MKKTKLTKITSMVLAVTIAAGTFVSFFSVSAGAALSLSNIETIKDTKISGDSPFKIVEIAPSAGNSAMGYYVKGQEPDDVKNWSSIAARLAGEDKRETYVNDLLTKLENKGLLSAEEDAAALKKTGVYEEHNPWNSDFADTYSIAGADTTKTAVTKLAISNTDQYDVTGSIKAADENKGGDYNLAYNYRSVDFTNLFDFDDWSSHFLHTDGNYWTMNGTTRSKVTCDLDKDELSMDVYGSTLALYDLTKSSWTLGGWAPYYNIPVKGGDTYIFSFKADLTKADGSLILPNTYARIYAYKSETVETTFVPIDIKTVLFGSALAMTGTKSGYYSYRIKAPSDATLIEIALGGAGKGNVKYSNISFTKANEDVDSVQVVDQFVNGDAAEQLSETNTFNFSDWSNFYGTNALNDDSGDGDTISFDTKANSVTIKSDGEGTGNDIYTRSYGSLSTYFMNVTPGKEYELSFDLDVKSGSAQYFLFSCGSDPTYSFKNPYNDSRYWYTNGYPSSSGHITFRFTAAEGANILQWRVGVSAANSEATFSNMKINEVVKPQYFYYSVVAEKWSKALGKIDGTMPDAGTEIYTKATVGGVDTYTLVGKSDGETVVFDGENEFTKDTDYYTKGEDGIYTKAFTYLTGLTPAVGSTMYTLNNGIYEAVDGKYYGEDCITFNEGTTYYYINEGGNYIPAFTYNAETPISPTEGTTYYTLKTDAEKEEDRVYEKAGIWYTGKNKELPSVGYLYTLSVTPGTYPIDHYDETHNYRAESTEYRLAKYTTGTSGNKTLLEDAYFIQDVDHLIYAEYKTGSYNIDFEGNDDLKVYTNTVYYVGGYVSNDYFKYHVLDWTDADDDKLKEGQVFSISVTTLTPDNAGLNFALSNADLIVIDNGVNLYDDTEYGYSADIPASVYNDDGNTKGTQTIVSNFVTKKGAVMVDLALNSSLNETATPNLKALVNSLCTYSTIGGVNGSVYVFDAADVSTSSTIVNSVANKNFCIADGTIANTNEETSPYYAVYQEIYQENAVRANQNVDLLGSDKAVRALVTEATCIRYILNYIHQKVYNTAATLLVLDLEPYTSTPGITPAEIREMLSVNLKDTYKRDENINIVTMSTAEFIAKNEEVSDNYDIVYIGSSTNNMNTITSDCSFDYIYLDDDGNRQTAECTVTAGKFDDTYNSRLANHKTSKLEVGDPLYNDASMQGMYYTNSGDKLLIGNKKLAGLVGDDYINAYDAGEKYVSLIMKLIPESSKIGVWLSKIYWLNDNDSYMRASGDDLNEAAVERLQHYVESGRPLIVADELTNFMEQSNYTLTAACDIKSSSDGKSYILNFTATLNRVTLNADGTVNSILDHNAPEGSLVTYQWQVREYDRTAGTYASSWAPAKSSYPTGDALAPSIDGNYTLTLSSGDLTHDANNASSYYYVIPGVGYYRCIATIDYMGTYDVNSNTLEVNNLNVTKYECYYKASYTGNHSKHYSDAWWRQFYQFNYWLEFKNMDTGKMGLPDGITCTVNYQSKDSYDWVNGNQLQTDKAYNTPTALYTRSGDNQDVKADLYFSQGSQIGVSFTVCKVGGSNTNTLYANPSGENDTDERGSNGKKYLYRDLYVTPDYYTFGGCDWDDNNDDTGVAIFEYQISFLEATDLKNGLVKTIAPPTELDTDAIDNCSNMWKFLTSAFYRRYTNGQVYTSDNIFNVYDAKLDRTMLSESLLISKPTIELPYVEYIQWPYSLGNGSEAKTTPMQITFKVKDPTNPLGDKSRYTASFYTDLNSSGKFSQTDDKFDGEIQRDTTYKWVIQFPAGTYGIIPWQIVITEKSNEVVKTKEPAQTTYTGYSYIKPPKNTDQNGNVLSSAQTIQALMILPGAWGPTYTSIDDTDFTEKQSAYDNVTSIPDGLFSENEYVGCIFQSKIFDDIGSIRRLTHDPNASDQATGNELGVSVSTDDYGGTGADGLYHMGFNVNDGDIVIDIAVTNINAVNKIYTADENSTFLDGYNLLVLGFGDSWGNQPSYYDTTLHIAITEGFETETAQAVSDYINVGNPAIFCHDSTNTNVNFINYFANDAAGWAYSLQNKVKEVINNIFQTNLDTTDETIKENKVKSGYWNNLILRDVLGLDRYGITYAINVRAEDINDGKTTDQSKSWSGRGRFDNKLIGRAHYYTYIYNWQTDACASDSRLTVTNMLDNTAIKGEDEVSRYHSIAYVPGTAETYGRNTDGTISSTDSSGVLHYAGEDIVGADGNIEADFDKYTQGFTDYTIARYQDADNLFPTLSLIKDQSSITTGQTEDDVFSRTDKVTQVNKGKITTYPYNVNVPDNDGNADGILHKTEDMNYTLDIESTHEQYYQCNMNGNVEYENGVVKSNDLTVWYCLSGTQYYDSETGAGIRNNAANAYYLTTRDNLTYTGAGHTNTFTALEAKLFINALVAAYRPSAVAPSGGYYNLKSDGTTGENEKYLLLNPTVKDGEEALEAEAEIHTKITDNNLSRKVWSSGRYYYMKGKNDETGEAGTKTYITDMTLTNAAGAKITCSTSEYTDSFGNVVYLANAYQGMDPNSVYSFAVPDSIYDEFAADSKLVSVDIYFEPYSFVGKIGSETTEGGTLMSGNTTSIQLRRLDLSKLG